MINEEIVTQLQREAKSYFSQLENVPEAGPPSIPGFGTAIVLDLRSSNEKRIVADAGMGTSIGPTFDGLVHELIAIGRTAEYTVVRKKASRAYDSKLRHHRAREIGLLLHLGGGTELMQAAACRVRGAGGDGRDLDRCWNGIGQWME